MPDSTPFRLEPLSAWRSEIQASGGIFRTLDSNLLTVSIRPFRTVSTRFSFRTREWLNSDCLEIYRIKGYRRAQYIVDAVYYYTGSSPYHFRDANLSFPPLQCIGRETSTPELLTTKEMCLNYVKHIAHGEGYEPHRADFIKKVKDMMNSENFVYQRERFLSSARARDSIPVVVTTREVQLSPKEHLELAMRCLEKVESKTSVQFNQELCQDLAMKLQLAVQLASACTSEPGCHQSFKLLFRLAREVESFIRCCCSDEWIQAALMLTDATEHVSLLGMDLDSCKGIFIGIYHGSYEARALQIMMVHLRDLFGKRQSESERIKILARTDREKLLEKVKAAKFSTQKSQSDLRYQTARYYLLETLTVSLNASILDSAGSCSWDFRAVDCDSLDHQKHLGKGAVGDVHKILWLGEEFAEKVFYGSDHPTFKNEVSILAGLSHPNIVHMFFHAMDNRSCSIVMELMEEDLFRLMQRRLRQDSTREFPFIMSEAVELIGQVAEGMKYLHENKIVHRDLKSRNILVKTDKSDQSEYVYAKVGDFGLSKTKETSITFSNQSSNIGTMRWMAPELMQDPGIASTSKSEKVEKHSFKSDVYSFGMVCYEILTGEVPFQSTRCSSEVRSMVLSGERPILPNRCPVVLRSLIQRCWDSNASARPRFDDICAELRYLKCLLVTNAGAGERLNWKEMKDELNTWASTCEYENLFSSYYAGENSSQEESNLGF